MVPGDKITENVRNGKRSRGSSPAASNGQSSSDEENCKSNDIFVFLIKIYITASFSKKEWNIIETIENK